MNFLTRRIPPQYVPWVVIGLFVFLFGFLAFMLIGYSPGKTLSPTESPETELEQTIQDLLAGDDELLAFVSSSGRLEIEFFFNALTEESADFEAQGLVSDILEKISDGNVNYRTVFLIGYTPFADPFGKVSRGKVLELVYSFSTIEKIQWGTFDITTIFELADSQQLHPILQK